LRFGIAENRRFSGSCNVIATARCPFRSLCSFKRADLPKFRFGSRSGHDSKLFQKKFDQKRRNRDGVVNRKLFQKKFDQKRRNRDGVVNRKLLRNGLIESLLAAA
jgi:hypothetical protein